MHFLARWAKRLSWTEAGPSVSERPGRKSSTRWNGRCSGDLRIATCPIFARLELTKCFGTEDTSTLRSFIRSITNANDCFGSERTELSERCCGFSMSFGKERSAQLRFVCSDMWKPYLKVIAKKASQAIHVLDRFHIAMHMNKAIDEVRAQEARDLKAKGLTPVLTHSRWCLLKRPENLTANQETKLSDLVAVQPQGRAQLSAQGGFPVLLGVYLPSLGWTVSGSLVQTGHAIPY